MQATNARSGSAGHASALEARRALAEADEALDEGNTQRSRQLASQVARSALELGDPRLEAEALLRLARADTVSSRLRSAHESAHRATHLFHAANDPAGEIQALVWLSYAASSLRHNQTALASSLFAVRLADMLDSTRYRVSALNSLGISMIANGDFERSDRALAEAAELAGLSEGRAAAFQPQINRCYGEIVRVTVERHLYGRAAAPARLDGFVRDARRLRESDPIPSRSAGRLATFGAMLWFAEAFAACWRGDVDEARAHAARISASRTRGEDPSWLDALGLWAECEVAYAARDWAAAETAVRRMIDRALHVEHEQIARTGFMLACQILEEQGRSREALEELRLLARRDIAIRRESLEHHERVARWQMELRESSMRVRTLEESSRELERLSLQDPLTGLPNRRHFEQELAAILAAGVDPASPLSIALIDVDSFKQINDTHSHMVGDRVLGALGRLISHHVRHGDLPARLGGDEFVVLFRRIGLATATAACARLAKSIARHPWHELADGLRVSASIGVAEAVPGDSIESLLRRADDEMYRAKGRKP